MTLTKVFEPIRIRNVEIQNRIVRTAHATGLSTPPGQFGGEDLIAYHVARARGGVGLTILEAIGAHPSGGAQTYSNDAVVERYQEMMEQIRPYGMRVFQQVNHIGHSGPAAGGGISWGVSTVPAISGNVGTPMTTEQIAEIIDAFAAAARRSREGGLDGVELHAAHGFLFAQFLSPIYNDRTDTYGGSLENRMRLTQEVLRSMREAVGPDFVVGIRLGASQMPGGIQEDELRLVIEALQREGLIDYVTTASGDLFRSATINAGPEAPPGYELPSSSRLAAVASVPTIVTGRFRTLEEAERVLSDGVADMVSMVRALMADPEIVRKTRDGIGDQIRPCIACNQGCSGGLIRARRAVCIVNVATGFERTLSEDLITRVAEPRRVLVVGGGPAGLEAARVAALAGHTVTLAEAASTPGGAVNAARRSPRHALIGETVDWLVAECRRNGVEFVLDTHMTAEDVLAHSADAVIVATGSRPRLDGFQPARPFEPALGVGQDHVLSSPQLLWQGVPEGAKTALVLDTVGHFEAIAVAEYLVGEGLAVTFLTSLPGFGGIYVTTTSRDVPALEFLYGGDFTLLVRHHLAEIRASSCMVHPAQGQRSREVPADVVVLVTQNAPNRELHDELVAAGRREVFLVGDAASPRDLQVAIAEGHSVARSIPSGVPAGAR